MCLHLFTRSSHTGKQTRIATLCKSIGHQARCPKPFTPRCKEDPDVAPRNQWTCLTTQQHGGHPIRALSSPCFLFFRPLLLTSSWMRVYGGEIICSSSPTWVYMARKISCSPGNNFQGRICCWFVWIETREKKGNFFGVDSILWNRFQESLRVVNVECALPGPCLGLCVGVACFVVFGGFVVGFFLMGKFDLNHMLIPVVDRPCLALVRQCRKKKGW